MNQIRFGRAIISTGHRLSAEAGLEVLKRGGNAVDAAVAAGFVECVVEPEMCGIGGYGGCMLVHRQQTGKTLAVDFNCCAGRAARPDMFRLEPADARDSLNTYEYETNVADDANVVGFPAVGIPGVVAGFGLAHAEFGRSRWADLVSPSAAVAANGFPTDPVLAAHFANHAKTLRRFPSFCAMFERDGRFPKEGDTLASPELARTLETIAAEGPRAFYTGRIAEKISAAIRAGGGHITTQDLETYVPFLCEPLRIRYRGREVLTPPLGNGGITTLQMLKILEGFPLPTLDRESPEIVHLFAEAAKLAWRDRLGYFADPRATPVDETFFLSDCHAEEFRKTIRRAAGGPEAPPSKSGECTTHISVIDEERNAVSVTFTHGMLFGACVGVPELGVTLGDGMFRFDPRPGHVNSAGPGKRVLNNTSPLLILRDGRPFISCGTPGGRRILSAMTWLTINLLDFGMDPARALAFPRCHCEAKEPVSIEHATQRPVDGAPGPANWRDADALRRGLEAMGHRVKLEQRLGGNAHAIVVDDERGELRSGTDPRGLGAALGL